MTDNLRTRITAVLYDSGDMPASKAARLADAVIAELDLKVENTYLSDDKTRRYVELGGFYGVEADDE